MFSNFFAKSTYGKFGQHPNDFIHTNLCLNEKKYENRLRERKSENKKELFRNVNWKKICFKRVIFIR